MTTEQTLHTRHEAVELAEHLLNPGRSRPAVVVTVADQAPGPYVDVTEIYQAVGDLCDVFVVPTGVLTWAMSEILPEGTQIYGGAARVYPVDLEWTRNPFASPLRLAFDPDEGRTATERLIGDALRFAGASSDRHSPATREVGPAVVKAIIPPTRAMLELADGRPCVLWCETLVPGLHVDQLVAAGLSLDGSYDARSRRFDVSPSCVRAPAEAVSEYAVGQVVLARVTRVLADRAEADLVPGLGLTLHRQDVTDNPIDRMTSLMSAGEVVAVRVVRIGRPGAQTWRATMIDVEDHEPMQPAPSVLREGPPWLRPEQIGTVQGQSAPTPPPAPGAPPKPHPPGVAPRPHPPGDSAPRPNVEPPRPSVEPVSAPPESPGSAPPESWEPAGMEQSAAGERTAYPVPAELLLGRLEEAEARISTLERHGERVRVDLIRVQRRLDQAPDPAPSDDIDAVRHERDALQSTTRAREQQVTRLEAEVAEHKTRLRVARQETQQQRKRLREDEPADHAVFTDPEQQFRWEVQQAWVRRVPAAEKPALPLGDFTLGPDFLTSLGTVEGVERAKVVDVVVDIATGRVHDLAGRETHQLRTSDHAGSAYRSREDGATCWRVALQVRTPGARRLHYWQPPGGAPPELSSVRHHDDMRP